MNFTLYDLNEIHLMPHLLFCSVFVLFLCYSSILSRFEFFFDLQTDLQLVSLKNNLRIMLGSI